MQIHTAASLELKEWSHGLYETFRATKDPLRMLALYKEQAAAARAIAVPPGALGVPHPRSRPMPGPAEPCPEEANAHDLLEYL